MVCFPMSSVDRALWVSIAWFVRRTRSCASTMNRPAGARSASRVASSRLFNPSDSAGAERPGTSGCRIIGVRGPHGHGLASCRHAVTFVRCSVSRCDMALLPVAWPVFAMNETIAISDAMSWARHIHRLVFRSAVWWAVPIVRRKQTYGECETTSGRAGGCRSG